MKWHKYVAPVAEIVIIMLKWIAVIMNQRFPVSPQQLIIISLSFLLQK